MKKTKEKIGNTPIVNNKPKKKFMLPLVLILILIGAVGYIAYDKYQEYVIEKEAAIFQLGAQSLYLELFTVAATCQTIPLNNGSLDLNLIATECLQLPQA